ncbi:alanine racemase [Salinarimonas chemoclinalis]|uniref:alanine racemase n=1 Tax=Salinarimonas chemoclinalis TaxID=3241599 RepID=UPI0035581964
MNLHDPHPASPLAAGLVFPPLVHPTVMRFLDDARECLLAVSDREERSVHVTFPEIFTATMQRFAHRLAHRGVRHEVLYATKVCRADSFLDACGAEGFGVDVASREEMREALACGVPGPRICLSGPFKRPDFVELAARTGALVTIDAPEELSAIAAALSGGGRRVDVLLRWEGRGARPSRFGFSTAELEAAVTLLSREGAALRLRGLAFHLRGYDLAERARSLDGALDILAGIGRPEVDTVNIGGGFPIRYVSEETWALAREEIALAATKGAYPAWSPITGDACLGAILDAPSARGGTLAARAVAQDVRLLLEPGRAALDQAAISGFRVIGVRDRGQEPATVYLGANCLSLSERVFDCEVWYDPLLVKASVSRRRTRFPVRLAGNSCLEDDVFTDRIVSLPARPEPGDLVVFVNTGPYQMDFAESAIHRMPPPLKLTAASKADCCGFRLR